MTDMNTNDQAENTPATNITDNEQGLWPSPGQKLKKLREKLGFSREKVSDSLYITVHYVTALENDEYAKLPGHTFIKGYYKSYAKFLNADPEETLKCYLKFIEHVDSQDKQDADTEESGNMGEIITWVVIVTVLSVALIGFAYWVLAG